jgi:hypothetical protein
MSHQKLAAVALFVFNRPQHTARTLAALSENYLASDSDLIIYSDGPRNSRDEPLVEEVRSVINSCSGFRSVRVVSEHENKGLAASVVDGVTATFEKYEQLVVLEDDLVTSKYFLTFMNEALDVFRDDSRVASIHGFTPPMKYRAPETFFLRGADCWGWGTWKRSWEGLRSDSSELLREIRSRNLERQFNLYGLYPYSELLERESLGQVDSWAIRWHASMFLADKYTLYPGTSLVDNIGMDGSGTHFRKTGHVTPSEFGRRIAVKRVVPTQDKSIARSYARAVVSYTGSRHSLRLRLRSLLGRLTRSDT